MNLVIIFLAKYLVFVVIIAALALVLTDVIRERNWRKLGFIVLAVLTAAALSQVLHLVPVETLRPYQIIGADPLVEHASDLPFPSDHTVAAFAMAGAVVFMTRFRKVGIVLLVLAALVAIGRMLALVHSPLDVIGGVAVATIGAGWYLVYYRWTRPRPERGGHDGKREVK
jgi:undecaprenyl-diphosphatase